MEIILGAAATLVTQVIKKNVEGEYKRLSIALGVALLAAGVYTLAVETGYWESALTVVGSAGAIYTYIVKRFES